MIISAVAGLGLKDVVIDEIASGRSNQWIVLSNAAAMMFIAGAILAISYLGIFSIIYPLSSNEFLVSLALSVILIMKGFDALLFGLEANASIRSSSLAQFISIIVSSLVKCGFIVYGANALSLAGSMAIEYVVLYGVLIIIALQKELKIIIIRPNLEYATRLLKRSWPLMASSIAVLSYFYIDQVFIAILMDAESVGVYSAASRISQQLYIIPAVLVAAYYPRLTDINTKSSKKFNEGFKCLSTVLMIISIVVCGITILLSEPLLELILGGQFDKTAKILKLHSLGLVLVALNVISGRWYVMHGLQKLTLIRQLLTAVVNCSLNLLLIPLYGIDGAVYATLASLLFLAFGFDLLSKKTIMIHSLKVEVVKSIFNYREVKNSFEKIKTL